VPSSPPQAARFRDRVAALRAAAAAADGPAAAAAPDGPAAAAAAPRPPRPRDRAVVERPLIFWRNNPTPLPNCSAYDAPLASRAELARAQAALRRAAAAELGGNGGGGASSPPSRRPDYVYERGWSWDLLEVRRHDVS